ncbi:MAG: hypothetical protein AAF547_22415 [Actinomycetota bacterium]
MKNGFKKWGEALKANLALVELVRRRVRNIIAVDASGDATYSFSALHEAIELAELECATRIRFVDDGLDAMRPGDRPKPVKNWCRAEIQYPDGATGRLLYVKAQTSEHMPLDVLRYAKEDPTFPNYSTADQLLRAPEFCNLAILGRESMIAALDDCHRWLFGVDAPVTTGAPATPGPTATPSVTTSGPEAAPDRPDGAAVGLAVLQTPDRRAAPVGDVGY